jgi:hypothetical protein
MDSTTLSVPILYSLKSVFGIPGLIAISSLLSIVIIVGLIVSYKTGKTFSIGVGPFRIRLGGNKNDSNIVNENIQPIDNNTKIITPNQNGCDDKLLQIIELIKKKDSEEDIKALINFISLQIREKQNTINTIKFKSTIDRQMSCVEDVNIEIKSVIMEHYAKILKTKNCEIDFQPKLNKDYRYYQMQITKILDDVKKNIIKESLNGVELQNLDPVEFEIFIEQKAKIIIMSMAEYMDSIHSVYNNMAVKIYETWLYDCIIKNTVQEKIKEIYKMIKQVIIEDENKIQELEKKMQTDIESMVKMIPNTTKSIKELLNI